jgi:tryptophan synthase beta chain
LQVRPRCKTLAVDVSSGVEPWMPMGIKASRTRKIHQFVAAVRAADEQLAKEPHVPTTTNLTTGHFGPYGGSFVSETLTHAINELRDAYAVPARPGVHGRIQLRAGAHFVGRPSPVYHAARMSREMGGAQIYLKREDLNHTGAHKINNTIGQAMLARRMGKPRVIAETGAGQHGVATATICARYGLECVVYMGSEDVKRQSPNVYRMKLLGATVVPVESGSKTLKDALNEAMRDWVTNVDNTFYIIGTVAGPHPYPMMVRDFQSVIGEECLVQMPEMLIRRRGAGGQPDAVWPAWAAAATPWASSTPTSRTKTPA